MNEFDAFYDQAELSFGTEPTGEIRRFVESTDRRGKALDLGAGDGRNALYLARAGYDVTAVDSSRVGLAKLEWFAWRDGLISKIQTLRTDVREALYEDSTYDLIVAVTLFDHLPETDIGSLFDRVVRSLRVGGALFVKVLTVADPGFKKNGQPASELSPTIRHYFGPKELLHLVDGNLDVASYDERTERDATHGMPHLHAFATMLALKTDD
jgi:cyclopropane fatty-acyl-phospholipid synthase-like methyltransferase